jgi:formamidopyrimidine-DNA glycosylase
MPELPEVETICRGTAPLISGKQVTACVVRRRDLRVPVPEDFEARCVGRTVESVERRGKYMLWRLEGGETAALHFGMSGRLVLSERDAVSGKHEHVLWRFPGVSAAFSDPRRFGLVTILPTKGMERHALFAKLGYEPFDPALTADVLQGMMRGARPVKLFLMDASAVVGVGNIYASEALFAAGIRPDRPCAEIRFDEIRTLLDAVRIVLSSSIESGGSTLRDYVGASGQAGYFQHTFRAYGREGLPCCRCGGIIKRESMAGRSTYFCVSCQR